MNLVDKKWERDGFLPKDNMDLFLGLPTARIH